MALGIVIAAALIAACDQGKQHNEQTAGPQITIISVKPPLTASGSIQIAVDRLLNPFTVTRQTVQLREAGGTPVTPLVSYDPVARVITLADPGTPGAWLKPGQPYKVKIGIPANGADDVGGVRAIDRATLSPADPLREFDFLTPKDVGVATPEPTMHFCSDVLPIFQRSCAASICHGTPRPSTDTAHFGASMSSPAAGLILEYANAVANTAIARVANGSNTGGIAGAGGPPQHLFGIDMPIVDPGTAGAGNPANSWLLYKVMLARPAEGMNVTVARRVKCDGTLGTPPQAVGPFLQSTPIDDTERAILSDYVLGREMPYPDLTAVGVSDPQTNPGLTFDELERIRLWISTGAKIDVDCGACEK